MERRPVTFDLLETMKWAPRDGFFLLNRHLARMRRSAQHFNYEWSESAVLAELARAVSGKSEPQRLRLLRVDHVDVGDHTTEPRRKVRDFFAILRG